MPRTPEPPPPQPQLDELARQGRTPGEYDRDWRAVFAVLRHHLEMSDSSVGNLASYVLREMPGRLDASHAAASPINGTLWLVSCHLQRFNPGVPPGSVNHTTSLSQSWSFGGTREHAVGRAVEYALKAKPHFSISQILTSEVRIPEDLEAEGDKQGDSRA
jgi:hypothetical protein